MEAYKINLHAHTIFSDGINMPYRLAIEAKALDFTALVITDHFNSLTPDRLKLLRKATIEAKSILPVIVGVELAFMNEEMLVFSSALINRIMQHTQEGRELTLKLLLQWKKSYNGGFVLCHPRSRETWITLLPLLDGYESVNSGKRWFKRDRSPGVLACMPSWCNSDAHKASKLGCCYNIVSSKITEEADLVKYLRRGWQPEFYLESENIV